MENVKVSYLRIEGDYCTKALTMCETLNKKHGAKRLYSIPSFFVWLLNRRHRLSPATVLSNFTPEEVKQYEEEYKRTVHVSMKLQREAIFNNKDLTDAQKIKALKELMGV